MRWSERCARAAAALAWLPLVAAVLAAGVPAGPARGHIVGNTTTVRGLLAESDLVVHARVVRNLGLSRSSEAPGSRPGVEVEVLEVLKGSLEGSSIRFAQHGHGVARFTPGEETLVFLVAIERSRELAALGRSGEYAWLSLQENDEKYDCTGTGGAALLDAVRGYSRAERTGSPEERIEAVHLATLALLRSGDTRLASAAVRDLVAAPQLPLVTAADLPVLEPILDDDATSMGVRVALLLELEGRGLLDGSERWQTWMGPQTAARDRVTAIRAVAGSGRQPERLIALLSDPDADVAAAAAIALGAIRDPKAVPPLEQALSSPTREIRMAAIRGLGGIGSPAALQALTAAGQEHPDPDTRRRALAEVRKRTKADTSEQGVTHTGD